MTQERKTREVQPVADIGGVALLDRPLSPRSLIGSLLLGMRAPRMPGNRLVEWCALFGVAEGTARVALSRMVERGELSSSNGTYELAGDLRHRQPIQDWSLQPVLSDWAGTWVLGLVEAGARTAQERSAFREAARRLRMAELRDGVWSRPDNLPRAAAPTQAWATADAQCTWWSARPSGDATALAARLFAPAAWAERAHALQGRLVSSTGLVNGSEAQTVADAFVVGAAALAHVRADPLLPIELCDRNWPGDTLRRAYRDYQVVFSGAVRDWFHRH
jgi:phenylacetic acid degradation operon negative regulatory protein